VSVLVAAAAIFCIGAVGYQFLSIGIAIFRVCRGAGRMAHLEKRELPFVSIVVTLSGIYNFANETLRSFFELDHSRREILFCVASATDPIIPLVRGLMEEYPAVASTLLIGEDQLNDNPKLNNMAKGWRAARYQWVAFIDSNVLLPRNYVELLFARWKPDTGLVTTSPTGSRPEGFWAEVECAFLNPFQARWGSVSESAGLGFAQGKTMLWRRTDLARAGGVEAMALECAEDAATTKMIRRAGLKIRMVDYLPPQPLGRRSASEVWARQIRWARMRKATFFYFFLPEAVTGAVPPMIALAFCASAFGLPIGWSMLVLGIVWYGSEMLLTAVAKWHMTPLYPLYGIVRDLILPVLFVCALFNANIVWQGNSMRARANPLIHRDDALSNTEAT
jgi:ceramide glucosyltransferase